MNFIAWTIIACEVGFWVVILLGLISRYIFKREKLGIFFLALTPVIDLVLLAITAIDLYNGAIATLAHAIAAVYLGVSIAFGKSMIQWADEKFLYYVQKQGSKPVRKTGMEHARHTKKGFMQHLLAFIIGGVLLLALIFFIDDSSRSEVLWNTLRVWGIILGIDFVITISYFIWPRPVKTK
ncbi:2TM domain-containing protein [Psychrobacillus sp. FSL H8-0483]|uniref:2TM domain-containing protein n=1 Tax=Psychrobacillus sp. FSL H8-0483 TaxID=2921389 RepID=UPI003159CB3B